ncbi:unnamed protein product [Blepharisma stoltei]|uniref:Uncharacterized protein n=1 Tax=Blepharisma stoltei TaxID=1481888 RepID=A0AAU9J2L2_9CILI|nr:unnamed protein product [Blepharisma stoltei]
MNPSIHYAFQDLSPNYNQYIFPPRAVDADSQHQNGPIRIEENPQINDKFELTFYNQSKSDTQDKTNEEELIEQAYGPSARDLSQKIDAELSEDIVSNYSIEDSLRNLVYSESSLNETPRLMDTNRSRNEDPRTSRSTDRRSNVEHHQIYKLFESFSIALSKVSNESVDNYKEVSTKISIIENKLADQSNSAKDFQENFEHKVKEWINESLKPLIEIKDQIPIINEQRESSDKSIEAIKAEMILSSKKTQDLESKLTLLEENLKPTFLSVDSLKEMQENLKAMIKELQSNISTIQSKLYNFKDANIKISKEINSTSETFLKAQEDLKAKLDQMSNEILIVRGNHQKLSTAVRNKVTKLEHKCSDLSKQQTTKEETTNIAAYLELEERIINLENHQRSIVDLKQELCDNVQKLNNSTNFQENGPYTPIRRSESASRLNTRMSTSYSKFPKRAYTKPSTPSAISKNLLTNGDTSPLSTKKAETNELEERLSCLEKLSIHRKAIEQAETIKTRSDKESLDDFLPGEAESVVVSSLLEKSKRNRHSEILQLSFGSSGKILSPMSASFKSLVSYSEKISPSYNENCSAFPSLELQETLKTKGFNVTESNPKLYRDSRSFFSETK